MVEKIMSPKKKGQETEIEVEAPKAQQEGELRVSDLEGVGNVAEEKLRDAGFDTVEMLAVSLPQTLVDLGLEQAQARKIIDAARKHVDRVGIKFRTGEEVLHEHETRFKLHTQIPSLDEMVGGGFEASTVSIIHGRFSAGKSQLSHWLTACALTDKQLNATDSTTVLYIDTENTFRPKRVLDFLRTLGGKEEDLARIFVSEAHNSDHQTLIVDHAGELVKTKNVKLLILDSLTAHFRSEYVGREMLARRQQTLNRHLQKISQLTRMFNLVTFVTTQEIDTPQQGYGGAPESKGAGGNVVFHRPMMILSVFKPEGLSEKRFVTLEKHPSLGQQRIVLRLNQRGFTDFETQKQV